MSNSRPTVVFFPEGAFGPTNNCVGIGAVLRRLGARVVFVVEESFAGQLTAQGFEERLMRLQPPPAEPEEPGQFWKDFIRDTAPEFRKSTFDQLETLILPIWQELVGGAEYVDPRLEEIFGEVQPDVVVEDNVVAFPAVVRQASPWVRIVSCNPLEIPDPALPPAFSGLPAADPQRWPAFRNRYLDLHEDLHRRFDEFVQAHGCPPLPAGQFIHVSPHLNAYVYPTVTDYPRSQPLGEGWLQLESSVRETEPDYPLPAEVQGDGPCLYLSLGSLGSADTGLMQRLLDLLAASGYRTIVSLGPQHRELRLRDRQAGAEFLPQTSILPQVDLVITHGGNNTVTESLRFGKPMVALPLFWDQHDNAQRLQETGLGVRLHPYEFEDRELVEAVERLVADPVLAERLTAVREHLAARPGTVRLAHALWELATGSPAPDSEDAAVRS